MEVSAPVTPCREPVVLPHNLPPETVSEGCRMGVFCAPGPHCSGVSPRSEVHFNPVIEEPTPRLTQGQQSRPGYAPRRLQRPFAVDMPCHQNTPFRVRTMRTLQGLSDEAVKRFTLMSAAKPVGEGNSVSTEPQMD